METWYQISHYSWEEPIKPIEVTRKSDKFLWIRTPSGGEKRRAKRSQWDRYFETFDEAVEHMADYNSRQIKQAKEDLNRAREKQQKFFDWLEAQNSSAT